MSNQLDATIAKRYDITVKQNQTFNPLLTFTDSAGAPIDLTGSTAKLSVRQTGACNTCDRNFDSPFDLLYHQDFLPTITGADSNQLQFNEVVKLSPGLYKYDLLIEYTSGEKAYFLTGNFRVKRSYTSI